MTRWLDRRVFAGLVIGLLLVMAVPWAAFADDVSNDLDNSVDATYETLSLTVGGNGTTKITVKATTGGGDSKPGCNLAWNKTVTFSVNTGAASVATVSPTELIFSACDSPQTVTVTAVGIGSTTIFLTEKTRDNPTTGTFNLAPATFTVNVSPLADTTPPVITPTISGTLGDNGWYTSDVTVTWTVSDLESAITSSNGCDATTITTDTAGTTMTCSATSAGGTSSESVTIKRDATAPVVVVTGVADGASYDYGTVPSADCTTTDATSDVAAAATASVPSNGNAVGENTVTCDGAKDNAGNVAAPVSVTYTVVDPTPPVITYTLTPPAPDGDNGWYTSDVTLTWSVVEDESPDSLAKTGCDDQSITADQPATTYSCAATSDGGSADPVDVTIKRDATAPVVTVTGVADGASYVFGSVPAAGCTTTDAMSGVAASATLSTSGGPLGSVAATCDGAKDNAGNVAAPVSVTYTVLAWTLSGFYQPVDMGGVFNIVKGGSTVPLKFEIFKGATESTDVADIKSLTAKVVACSMGALVSEVEEDATATGNTSLRYDTTAGQFIYNWKTPKTPGKCYAVTMTAQDGSSLTALFKLK